MKEIYSIDIMYQVNHQNITTLSRALLLLLLISSCSKKVYPDSSSNKSNSNTNVYENKTTSADSKELKAFLAYGNGKYLDTGSTSADNIIKTARKYLGTPHCMGGSTKKCIDCSGLVMAVFAEHGILLPHSSEEQARYGTIIRNKTDLRKGDLVFFINTYKTSKYITHAGIYIGNNEMIHTSSSKGVMVSSLDNVYWREKFIFGTRMF